MNVRFSNHQHGMLELFAQMRDRQHMSMSDAQTYNQTTFRSMLIRGYIAWRPGRGFYVTRKGMDAWNEFHTAVIIRKDPTGPLTRYFDATAYGLDQRGRKRKASVHVMPKAQGAT